MTQLDDYTFSNETVSEYTDIIASLMEHSNDCVCITDIFGSIYCCSLEFSNKFGYLNPNSLIGSNITNIITPINYSTQDNTILDLNEFLNSPYIGHQVNHSQFTLSLSKRILTNYNPRNSKLIFFISKCSNSSQTDFYDSKYSLVKSVFLSLSTALFSKLDLDELLQEILKQIGRVISFDSASISLLNNDFFNVVAVTGFENPKSVIGLQIPKIINKDVPSPNLLAIQNRKSYRLNDVPNEYPAFVNPPGLTVRSWMVIPLLSNEYGIGTLNLDSYKLNAFSAEDQYIGELFAAQVSVAIENSMKFMESEKNAKIDLLTGLLTRRQMLQLSIKEIAQFDPINHPISVVLFDIDNFKNINDSKGHLFGDLILKEVAEICSLKMRQNDIFSRFGGDEFIVIMPDTRSTEGKLLAERLCQTIACHSFSVSGQEIKISASFGVTNFLNDDTLESAMARADSALYSAKSTGRNQVKIN